MKFNEFGVKNSKEFGEKYKFHMEAICEYEGMEYKAYACGGDRVEVIGEDENGERKLNIPNHQFLNYIPLSKDEIEEEIDKMIDNGENVNMSLIGEFNKRFKDYRFDNGKVVEIVKSKIEENE